MVIGNWEGEYFKILGNEFSLNLAEIVEHNCRDKFTKYMGKINIGHKIHRDRIGYLEQTTI